MCSQRFPRLAAGGMAWGHTSPRADVCAFTCAVERSRSPPHMCCCRYNELLPASILGGGDCGPCCSLACRLLAHCAFTSVVRVQVTQGAPGCYLPAPLVLGGWVEQLTLLILLTGPAGPCWAAAFPAHAQAAGPALTCPQVGGQGAAAGVHASLGQGLCR